VAGTVAGEGRKRNPPDSSRPAGWATDANGLPEATAVAAGASAREISRRRLLLLAVGAAAAGARGAGAAPAMIRRPIQGSGELLPVIGLGTWRTFDVGRAESERAPLREVLGEFVRLGGRVVDSSPVYGRAEQLVGDLAAELGAHRQLFLATKVLARGREAGVRQMEESLRRLRVQRLDLMQVHNLSDWRTQLGTLRRWKAEGKVRYIGVTHHLEGAHDELARVLATEPLDFVQLNYSIAERRAERRLLPLAAERRTAVIVNRPFAEGALFAAVRGAPLPSWAAEIGCSTWAHVFLKFVISHPAVTCVIPATRKVRHLVENMRAGVGPLPDETLRARMASVLDR
jgi:aryl-alcohol dehydrogenase-like predicted oxidoreductase